MKKLLNRVAVDCTQEEIAEMRASIDAFSEHLLSQSAVYIREQRNRLLAETDWMALSDNTMTDAWASYRQALRDITAQEGFPYSVTWPTKP